MTLSAHLPRTYVTFLLVLTLVLCIAVPISGLINGFLGAFDVAAVVFLGHLAITFRRESAARLRAHAERYDPSKSALVVFTLLVLAAVAGALVAELTDRQPGEGGRLLLALLTLLTAWLFANAVFAIRYAHLFYDGMQQVPKNPGLVFPETPEPDFWDFCYLSFTLGMTFQVSDVIVTGRRIRRHAAVHGLVAFLFSIGAVALTVNIVAGSR